MYILYIVVVIVVHTQSCPTLCNPTDCSCQAPSSMGFSRRKYWSGLPFPPPGDLPNPGLKPLSPESPALQADSLPLSHWGSPIMYSIYMYTCVCVYLYLVYVCIYIIYSICVCMFYVYIIYENMSTVAQRKFPRFVN